MTHISFAKFGALGLMAMAGVAASASSGIPPSLLCFSDAAGTSSLWMPMAECKLSTAIDTMWTNNGLFVQKTYRPGRPVFGNITFSMDFGGSPADEMVSALLHSTPMPPQTAKVMMVDDWLTRACSLYTCPECVVTRWSSPPCDLRITKPGFDRCTMQVGAPVSVVEKKYPAKSLQGKQKAWLCCNFRVTVPGLEGTQFISVDPITLDVSTADLDGDGMLDYTLSDLVMSCSVGMGKGMYDWIKSREARPVTVDYLDTDGTVMATLTLASVIPIEVTDHSTGLLTLRGSSVSTASWDLATLKK